MSNAVTGQLNITTGGKFQYCSRMRMRGRVGRALPEE